MIVGVESYAASPIPRDKFKVLFADSEETYRENGRKENIIDSSLTSHWHTEWSTQVDPPHPHEIYVDLGAEYQVDGFDYLPRQDGLANGRITDFQFFVSSSTDNWGEAALVGRFGNSSARQTASLPTSKRGRYVRLKALGEVSGKPWTVIADFNVLGRLPGLSTRIKGVAVVAQSGGDYESPIDAMNNSMSGDAWCSDPSDVNPCLIKIMPGVFALDEPLVMKPYIEVEGSGPNVTVLGISADRSAQYEVIMVNGASNSGIRSLSIKPGVFALSRFVGIKAHGAYNLVVEDVEIIPDQAERTYGLQLWDSSALISRVKLAPGSTMGSTVVELELANVTIIDSEIIASGGEYPHVAISSGESNVTLQRTKITSTSSSVVQPSTGIVSLFSHVVVIDSSINTRGPQSRALVSGENDHVTVRNSILSVKDNGCLVELDADPVGDTSLNFDNSVLESVHSKGLGPLFCNAEAEKIFIGASRVNGDPSTKADIKCVGAYNENYVALDGECHAP